MLHVAQDDERDYHTLSHLRGSAGAHLLNLERYLDAVPRPVARVACGACSMFADDGGGEGNRRLHDNAAVDEGLTSV